MSKLRYVLMSMGVAWGLFGGIEVQSAVLVNPDFETGDYTGWASFGQGWRIGLGADAQAGTYGAVNDVLATDGDAFRGIYQSVAVVGGKAYSGGAWIRAVSVDTSESWFELQWLDAGNGVISQLQSTHVTADQPFTFMGLTRVVAPANAVSASVRGIVQMHSAPADSDFHIFDSFDFQAEVIPEPGTFSLLGGAGVLLAWWGRRSRRRKISV